MYVIYLPYYIKTIGYPKPSSVNRPVPRNSEIPHLTSTLDDILRDSQDEDTLSHKDKPSSDFSINEKSKHFLRANLIS